MSKDWQSLAKEKRESILAAIPPEWRIDNPPNDQQVDVTGAYIQQYLKPREVEITETPAEDILKRTTTGQWSAEEVTRAFCHRAALAHQLTNCLHEIFFDAALANAKSLDAHYATHEKPIGPLHGLPISLKDQFHVRDVETTMGYVGWIGTFEGQSNSPKYKSYESEMVQALRASGAVLYVKTSVPHTLMTGETVNNIIDYTWNPTNRLLSAGGSSGGEGALISLKGSPVGFGTDIGGSIRIPAAFNGIYGIRPSTGRLPYEGMANSMDGQNSIVSVVGPLAGSVGGLKVAVKAVLGQKPWLVDPGVVEMPWREEVEREVRELMGGVGDAGKKGEGGEGGKLCFAVFENDGLVSPTPPVRRAIKIVVDRLKELGHTVVEWKPPSHAEIQDWGNRYMAFDGGRDIQSAFALSGEPMAPQIALYKGLEKEFTGGQIAATNVKLRHLKKGYMDYWNSTAKVTGMGRPVDAVITPVAPWPAARRERFTYYGYSGWVNVVDYTSVVVPVMKADKSVDGRDEGYRPLDERDRGVWEAYDPEIYDGAHVSVQLVGRRLQEEKMLAIAEYVDKAIRSGGSQPSL